jgi:hypothetical protein
MLGIPITRPVNIDCDNEAVTKNAIMNQHSRRNSIQLHVIVTEKLMWLLHYLSYQGRWKDKPSRFFLTKLLPQGAKDFSNDQFMY